jgi:hypothetical protein
MVWKATACTYANPLPKHTSFLDHTWHPVTNCFVADQNCGYATTGRSPHKLGSSHVSKSFSPTPLPVNLCVQGVPPRWLNEVLRPCSFKLPGDGRLTPSITTFAKTCFSLKPSSLAAHRIPPPCLLELFLFPFILCAIPSATPHFCTAPLACNNLLLSNNLSYFSPYSLFSRSCT